MPTDPETVKSQVRDLLRQLPTEQQRKVLHAVLEEGAGLGPGEIEVELDVPPKRFDLIRKRVQRIQRESGARLRVPASNEGRAVCSGLKKDVEEAVSMLEEIDGVGDIATRKTKASKGGVAADDESAGDPDAVSLQTNIKPQHFDLLSPRKVRKIAKKHSVKISVPDQAVKGNYVTVTGTKEKCNAAIDDICDIDDAFGNVKTRLADPKLRKAAKRKRSATPPSSPKKRSASKQRDRSASRRRRRRSRSSSKGTRRRGKRDGSSRSRSAANGRRGGSAGKDLCEVQIDLSKDYFDIVEGRRGETKRKLEKEFSVTIAIPDSGYIVIAGDRGDVMNTIDEISTFDGIPRMRNRDVRKKDKKDREKDADGGRTPKKKRPRTSGDSAMFALYNLPPEKYGSVIGRQGENVDRLQREYRVEVKVPVRGDDGEVVLIGTRADCRDACDDIQRLRGMPDLDFEEVEEPVPRRTRRGSSRSHRDRGGDTTLELDVPAEKFGLIVGRGGDTLNGRLQEPFRVKVYVPRHGETGSITVTGSKPDCEDCIEEMERILDTDIKVVTGGGRREKRARSPAGKKQSTYILDLPQEKFGLLIGTRGETVSKLNDQYCVRVSVPGRDERGRVRISGLPGDVEDAVKRIEAIPGMPEIRAVDERDASRSRSRSR
eukprot:TRINITY_DN4085_c1_g1_i1.p1 TRINITY_DN4085_c1_g1~~TRINITY_DN4085_c1_g1_i1.p1  ORF type:complete len:658 (+),score=228.58 TRINITY_DN4085_c1_g1_i1:262-2235(+)